MDRRTVLRGVCGTVGVAALAGCAGLLGQGTDASDGTSWLPAPGVVSSGYGVSQYNALLTSPTSVSNHREVLGPDWESYQSRWLDTEYAFPTASELDVVASGVSEAGELFRVESGSVDSGRIAERLDVEGFEVASGGDPDYSYYVSEDRRRGHAVNDSAIVTAQIPEDSDSADPSEFDFVGLLDAIIDSNQGVAERYTEETSALVPLANQGLSGDSILYDYHGDRFDTESTEDLDPVAGEFTDHVATGQGQQLSGETTSVTFVLAFENEETFIQNPIESNVDTYVTESPQFQSWREVDWRREGRTVIINGVVRSTAVWPLQQATPGRSSNENA
jgi:hypothetical protein